MTTRVHVLRPVGVTRIWLPKALIAETPFQRHIASVVTCDGGSTRTIANRPEALGIVAAEFPRGTEPMLTLRTRVATRDWAVGDARAARVAGGEELKRFLQPTRHVPTDGIVKRTADGITRGAESEEAKARAIYEWIVENTYRDPKARGCGVGDIRPMLASGNLGGKCADLNALYVGLARASGLPARDVYGIRIAPSRMGDTSLGVRSEDITKAQHCRAEVYLSDRGWVPVDPADVRKVVLEESPGQLPLSSAKVEAARKRLFGSWEMNWMAFNYAQDVALPGSSGPSLHFFMYPQAETAEGRVDCLDPESFRYEITSHEISSES